MISNFIDWLSLVDAQKSAQVFSFMPSAELCTRVHQFQVIKNYSISERYPGMNGIFKGNPMPKILKNSTSIRERFNFSKNMILQNALLGNIRIKTQLCNARINKDWYQS
jgi:hypothetical protein